MTARKTDDPVTGYARDATGGRLERAVGRLEFLACERHLRDMESGDKRGLAFNAKAADRTFRFMGYLRQFKGEFSGQPLVLQPWQQFAIGSVFGWVRAATGWRRFQTAYNEVCRKNGKSTKAAGIGLKLLIDDGEPGAEVYSTATKRDQAKIVHGAAVAMVRKSAALRKRIKVTQNTMSVDSTVSVFQALGADADTLDGLNPSGAIVDELHKHKNRVAWDVVKTGQGARRQPLLWAITTAPEDINSVCYEQREYSIKVLEEVIEDDAWFAYIACIDEGDEWDDERVWGKANPNLGVSVKLDFLRSECREAKGMGPAKRATFKRMHCGVAGEGLNRAIDIETWRAGGRSFDIEAFEGRECYGGLDLSSRVDLSSLALLFPPEDEEWTGRWHLINRYYMPADNMFERKQKDRVPYPDWAKEGWICATDGVAIDYDFIRNDINELGARFVMREIGFDEWNAAQLATQLQDQDGFTMVKMPQGFKTMSGPTKDFFALVKAGRLNHGNNPVTTWCASNVICRRDANDNQMPDKSKSRERIDGIVGAVMATGRALLHEPVDDGLEWPADRDIMAA